MACLLPLLCYTALTGDERDAYQHAEATAGVFSAHARCRFRRVGRLLLATALFPVQTHPHTSATH